MARGWNSIHPQMAANLKNIGIKEWQITQGYGTAKASAGYHKPEGTIDNHFYSSCVDLTWSIASIELKDRLIEAGFCPFFREWTGNYHIHAVFVGAKDGYGKVRILPGPRMQIIDYINGKDGLVGHNMLVGKYAPNAEQRLQIKRQYEAWAPHVNTKVFSSTGSQINCYAFMEPYASKTRCEVRSFYEWWGVKVFWDGSKIACSYKDKLLDTSKAEIKIEGSFARGNIRQLAEALGLTIDFREIENGYLIHVG